MHLVLTERQRAWPRDLEPTLALVLAVLDGFRTRVEQMPGTKQRSAIIVAVVLIAVLFLIEAWSHRPFTV